MTTSNNTVNTISAQLDALTFGLNVVTKYTNNKITATLKHGGDIKTTAKVSYDYAMNSNENHLNACLVCLEKVLKEHDKTFAVISYSYNEKDDGYSFTCTRIL